MREEARLGRPLAGANNGMIYDEDNEEEKAELPQRIGNA
jgi:hypothetical protein